MSRKAGKLVLPKEVSSIVDNYLKNKQKEQEQEQQNKNKFSKLTTVDRVFNDENILG